MKSLRLLFAFSLGALLCSSASAMVAVQGSLLRLINGQDSVYDNYMENYHIDPVPLIGNWPQNIAPEMHCSYINSMMANDMIDQAYSASNTNHDPNTSVYVGTVTRGDGNHMWVVVFIVRGGSTVAAYSYDVWTGTRIVLAPTEYAPGQIAYHVPEVGYVAPNATDLTIVSPDGPSSTVDSHKIRYGQPKPDYFTPMP